MHSGLNNIALKHGFEKAAILPAQKKISNITSNSFLFDWALPGKKEKAQKYFTRLPEIRSIIILLSSYFHGDNCVPEFSKTIARFARGRDYHSALAKKAASFFDELCSDFPFLPFYKILIDNHPFDEKNLAVYSGLCFHGKNSLAINRELGSFFNIVLIFTEANFEEASSVSDTGCGDCSKCKQICPTSALNSDYVLDQKLCLSYLTIENKNGIPKELADVVINKHFYGCDLCQEVCPFNQGILSVNKKWCRPVDYMKILGRKVLWPETFSAAEKEKRYKKFFSNFGLSRLSFDRFCKNYKLVFGKDINE